MTEAPYLAIIDAVRRHTPASERAVAEGLVARAAPFLQAAIADLPHVRAQLPPSMRTRDGIADATPSAAADQIATTTALDKSGAIELLTVVCSEFANTLTGKAEVELRKRPRDAWSPLFDPEKANHPVTSPRHAQAPSTRTLSSGQPPEPDPKQTVAGGRPGASRSLADYDGGQSSSSADPKGNDTQ